MPWMKPYISAIADKRLSDEDLWGTRPVAWGLRMLGASPRHMVESFTAGERREASEFLGVELPATFEEDDEAQRLDASVAKRRESIGSRTGSDSVLDRNLGLLQEALHLSRLETDLVTFRAMLRLHPGFEALAGKYVGLCADFVFHRRLAWLFEVPDSSVTSALDRTGRLIRCGLVDVCEGVLGSLDHRLRLLPGIISHLIWPAESASELVARILPPQREAQLQISDYPHLATEVELLRGQLGDALTSRSRGANVLLYGKPGTGKTELVAALAASLGSKLYVLQSMDSDDESRTPRIRLRQLAQLQRLMRVAERTLVMVDEAEDLFPTWWSDSEKVPTKAAINECLEQNPTPTIWISNRIRHMDEAFLRRFDLVVQVPPLPSSLRRDLLRSALPPHTLQEQELRRIGERRELTPAVLARMARVAMAGGKDKPVAIRANLHVLVGQYLKTVGARPLAAAGAHVRLQHDPALLNTEPPVDVVLTGIPHVGCGARLLLHGAPGTGKTDLARALAERLDKPLLQRQGSSLLSCFVGGTEENLREMFDEARREDGLLLLDEADSFLSSREQARARWEVTQTNELLTQMEGFEGIFVCTTNRLDDLDQAVLRRFDFKVEFKPLRVDQRLRLIGQCCATLGIAPDDEEALIARAKRLEGLTPGDAAAALRRLRFSIGKPDIAALLDALSDECRYKPAAHAPIGFVH
jgi:SpoVK/Ycf46/Vps4 family AAA+-type ATPase